MMMVMTDKAVHDTNDDNSIDREEGIDDHDYDWVEIDDIWKNS